MRRIATKRVKNGGGMCVIAPSQIQGYFDAIFALSVLQRQPHMVDEIGLEDLSSHYPFERFDRTVTALVERLTPGGILCVINNHYRVEDSSAANFLDPVCQSPAGMGLFFEPNGRRSSTPPGRTLFRKRVG